MTTGGWRNPPLRLYHGTIDSYVSSILVAVDVGRGRSEIDFGQGFYTTTVLRQALGWADQVVERRAALGARPAVIQFDLPRDADDFWDFVIHCRGGGLGHRPDGSWYDVVVGPVTLDWKRRLMVANSDQISFHTARAVALLKASQPQQVVP